MKQGHGGLWSHALKIYAQPRVSDNCLAVQDRLGINVCLLLALVWLAARGRRCTPASLDRYIACAADWDEVLLPLRRARRALRSRHPALHAEAAKLELAVERQLLLALEDCIEVRAVEEQAVEEQSTEPAALEPRRALAANLDALFASSAADPSAGTGSDELANELKRAIAIPGWDALDGR